MQIRRTRGWGAPKIQRILRDEFSHPPSIDAIQRVLVQNDLVKHKKSRRKHTRPGPPPTSMDAPNATWTTDFKGEFRTGDGSLCYPLTVQDGHSRFLLECHGLEKLEIPQTRRRFELVFREYGLPERIRSDNGHPFASTALSGLSQLSVWWIKLGIMPELIEPGKPQQNGRHERMHRTLKAETALPPKGDLPAQQQAFAGFRAMFNYERPHQALGQERPASLYTPSARPYCEHPEPLVYPAQF